MVAAVRGKRLTLRLRVRLSKQGGGLGLFDHPALMQHQNMAAKAADHRQVVADERQGQAEIGDQPFQQVQDLRLGSFESRSAPWLGLELRVQT